MGYFRRYPYGFKIFARLRAWLERRRGHETRMYHELVWPDGSSFRRIPDDGFTPTEVALYGAMCPQALEAWVVYVTTAEDAIPLRQIAGRTDA